MTAELRKAVQGLRRADDVSEISHCEEVFTEAIHKYGENCRREAIEACQKLVQKCGNIEVTWDALQALLDE